MYREGELTRDQFYEDDTIPLRQDVRSFDISATNTTVVEKAEVLKRWETQFIIFL